MKQLFALLLTCVFLCSSAYAAPDLTVINKDPSQFALSDCYELIGKDLFGELVALAATNAVDRSGFTYSQHLESGRYYSPQLTALLYKYQAQGKDPHEILFQLGDTSPDLLEVSEKLVALGYLKSATDTFSEDFELAIRQIQLAAQYPVNGKLTAILAEALLADFIPQYSITLPYIAEVAEHAIKDLASQSEYYMSLTKAILESPVTPAYFEENGKFIIFAYGDLLYDAERYFPEYINALSIQSAILNPASSESYNIMCNLHGLFGCILYCANYELSSDYLRYQK